jgi:hypothetical protein
VTFDRSVVFYGSSVSSTNKTDRHDIAEIVFSILGAIHGMQARSIQNNTLENRIVALEKLVENLEDRIKNGTNSSLNTHCA